MARVLGPRIQVPASTGYSVALSGVENATPANSPRIWYRNIAGALKGKNAATVTGWIFIKTQQNNLSAGLDALQQIVKLSYNGGLIFGWRYSVQGNGVTELQLRPNGIGFTNGVATVTNRPGLFKTGYWTHFAFGLKLSSALAPGGIADGSITTWVDGTQNFIQSNFNWFGGSEPNGVTSFLADNVAADVLLGDLTLGASTPPGVGDGNASCLAGGYYDIRMYDTLLTTAEVNTVRLNPLANVVKQSNLALWLKMDEGAGTNLTDSSGRTYSFQNGGQLAGNGLAGAATWSATNTPFGLLP